MAAKRWKAASKARTRETRANLPSVATIGLLEIEEAERDIVREIQRNHYGQEMDDLIEQRTSSPSSRGHVKPKSLSLRPHNPFVDEDGLLRVGSRLINADIAHEQKFPLILPPKDTVVRSMIRSMHLKLVHAGPKATLTVIRHKFWVNKGLQATKSIINAA